MLVICGIQPSEVREVAGVAIPRRRGAVLLGRGGPLQARFTNAIRHGKCGDASNSREQVVVIIKDVFKGYIDKLQEQEPEELLAVFLRQISGSPP